MIYWIDSLYRTASNNVEAVFGTQIIGDYSDYWSAYVSGSESLGSTQLQSSANSVGYGGNDIPGSSGTAAGWYWNYAPSSVGAETIIHPVTIKQIQNAETYSTLVSQIVWP